MTFVQRRAATKKTSNKKGRLRFTGKKKKRKSGMVILNLVYDAPVLRQNFQPELSFPFLMIKIGFL